MATTRTKNSISNMKQLATSILYAEDAPIKPDRVGSLFNDIIDYLHDEGDGSSSSSSSTGGVSSIFSLLSEGTPIARFTYNGVEDYIRVPNTIGGGGEGANLGEVWNSLQNSDDAYKDCVIHYKHLQGYTWWGQTLNSANKVVGDLSGSIGKITFNKSFSNIASTASIELEANNTLKITGNIYATGSVSALGTSGSSGSGGSGANLNAFLNLLNDAGLPELTASDSGKTIIWDGTNWNLDTISNVTNGVASDTWAEYFNGKSIQSNIDGISSNYYLAINSGEVEWDNALFTRVGTLEGNYLSLLNTINSILENDYTNDILTAINDWFTAHPINNDTYGVKSGTVAEQLNDDSKGHGNLLSGYLLYDSTNSTFSWVAGSAITTIMSKSIGNTVPRNGEALVYNSDLDKWTAKSYYINLNGSGSDGISLGSIYAPVLSGLQGLLLKSNGSGLAPSWANANDLNNLTVGKANKINVSDAKKVWGNNYIDSSGDFLNVSGDICGGEGGFAIKADYNDGTSSTTGISLLELDNNTLNTASDSLKIGHGAWDRSINTALYGKDIKFNVNLHGSELVMHTSVTICNLDSATCTALFPLNKLSVGKALLEWESGTNSLKIKHADTGAPINFYTAGGISALGLSSNNSGAIANATITTLTSTIINVDNGLILYSSEDGLKLHGQSRVTLQENSYADSDGLHSLKFYFDSTHYLYLDEGTLKFFDGSVDRTVNLT